MNVQKTAKKYPSLKSSSFLIGFFMTTGLVVFACASYLALDSFFAQQEQLYKGLSQILSPAHSQNLYQGLAQGKSLVLQTMAVSFAAVTLLILAGAFLLTHRLRKSTQTPLTNLHHTSHTIADRLHGLHHTSRQVTSGTASTAASLQETAASLEELSSMVKMNSDNARQAASLAQATSKSAQVGEAEMAELIQAIKSISDSSRKIEDIINVIDDIAFQTNLLALNASVEAARAGEQGKGFSVVAEAVRALAQKSAASAKDIESLIKNSVEQINHGRVLADKSAVAFNEIVLSIKKMSDLNNEISTASEEQASGLSQINHAMNQIDASSQSNALATEEILSTTESMASFAESTQSEILNLCHILSVEGQWTPTSPISPAAQPETAKAELATSTESSGQVVPFKKPTPATVAATTPAGKSTSKTAGLKPSDIIPFDEDERAKVGTTDDF